MASYNSTDADIESLASGETYFFSTSEQGIQFLVFDCDKTEFLVPGELIRKKALTSTEKAQRDVILSYKNPNCSTINSDQYFSIFGSNHTEFLSNIHSILVLLPCHRHDQVTFFISKRFANTPVHISQNESLLESPAPFYCRSLLKPVTLDNIIYVKQEMSENLNFCHDNEDAESMTKTEHFNNSQGHAHYLHVVKCKTNIVKFAYHKSYQSSQILHIECLSTDTIGQILQTYLKRISKDLPEFRGKNIDDLSVTDDSGKRVDSNLQAVICLLYNDKPLLRRSQLSHSYPSFLVHLTPKVHSYLPIRVRIHGEERGHMHPFTVFIETNFSTDQLQNEISKHCHWSPKSFQVCLPNTHKSIPVVDSLRELDFQLNSKSILSVHRIKKLKLSIECSLPHWSNFVVEEFPMCSVEELKNKISKRHSILPKQFDLVYKNRLLDDNILLESIIEQNASLKLKINENRIIFKLYLHKGLPNRSNIDMFKNFVHVKVDEPEEEELGDITRSFAQKLQLQESDLHITQQGFYLDKNQKYSDCNVYDGSILCICCCENSIRENKPQHTLPIFQAHPSGFFEKVTEDSVTAMAIKLRQLQLQQEKKREPKLHIISKRGHNQKLFNRMISVPSKSPKDSLAFGVGYKSDTDLIRHSKTSFPCHSPSDSQIGAHTTSTNNASFPSSPKSALNISTQAISSNQGTHQIVMSPPSNTVATVTNHGRQLNLPGSTGFQMTFWSQNGGNIPNMANIFGTPKVPHISNSASPDRDPFDKLFLPLSKEIVSNWKNVARHLDIVESNINIIDHNHSQVEEKAYRMLQKWKEINGCDVKKEVLIKALEECELKRVAELVEAWITSAAVQDENVSDLDIDCIGSSDGELEL